MVTGQNHFSKDISKILQKVNDITRNQIFIDIMLLIQGINFVIHPQEAHKGIIESLAITVFITALGVIIGFMISKGFKKSNIHTILVAFLFAILSIIIFFSAECLAPAFQFGIAILIIVVGIINILAALHLIKLNHAKNILKNKITIEESKDEAVKDVSAILSGATEQNLERVFSPAVVLSSKISRLHFGQVILNLILVIIGIVIIFFRFRTNAILMRVSGGILIFSAVADAIAMLWTHREAEFVKTLTHPLWQNKNK